MLPLSFAQSLASIAASCRDYGYESACVGLAKLEAVDLIKQVAVQVMLAVVATVVAVVEVVEVVEVAAVVAVVAVVAMVVAVVDSDFSYHGDGHLEVVVYDDCFLLAHRS